MCTSIMTKYVIVNYQDLQFVVGTTMPKKKDPKCSSDIAPLGGDGK